MILTQIQQCYGLVMVFFDLLLLHIKFYVRLITFLDNFSCPKTPVPLGLYYQNLYIGISRYFSAFSPCFKIVLRFDSLCSEQLRRLKTNGERKNVRSIRAPHGARAYPLILSKYFPRACVRPLTDKRWVCILCVKQHIYVVF